MGYVLLSRFSAADVFSVACQRMRGAQLRGHNRISYSRVRNWWHVSQCLSTCVLAQPVSKRNYVAVIDVWASGSLVAIHNAIHADSNAHTRPSH